MKLLFATMTLLWQAHAQQVSAVDSVAITVSDPDRAAAFFTKVLDFEPVSDQRPESGHRVVRLKLGEEFVELHGYARAGRPVPPDHRGNDRLFQHVAIIVSDMDRAYQRLRSHKVRHASSGPQRLPDWNPNAGGIKAFYFRDPDGHFLEILEFPAGKGDPKWQRKDRLFLGIDHTAIVVASTEDSLAFYRGRLGLRVAGESENYGFEQEHLNNVFGARLRITALRARSGPGIELLEYISPTDGRPFPADLLPNDLGWWQTRLVVNPNENAPEGTIPDPDGHRMQLIRKGGDL